ncbi:hypothetical protein ID866_7840 [Astraeus odoratus]|nr:hypothetical protein ID866_7840 [Astraeus odoratus]
MSSPSARAEARRKAILGRGSDRLARLTTSARGEDATAYIQTDVPVRSGATPGLTAFTGEETPPPPPASLPTAAQAPRVSPPPPFFTAGGQPDPSALSDEQQRQLMQALMGASPGPSTFTPPQPPTDDPLSSIMAQLAQAKQGPGAGAPAAMASPQPPSRLQKLLPLLHMVCMWFLLAFFVLWKEPQIYAEQTGAVEASAWKRWQTLAQRRPDEVGWGVQLAPFFWAFMTLQIMLHSIRIFTGHAQVQPPKLLAIALPHLPPPFPALVMNALQYLQLGGVFLDDIAAIVFGIGMLVLVASWLNA